MYGVRQDLQQEEDGWKTERPQESFRIPRQQGDPCVDQRNQQSVDSIRRIGLNYGNPEQQGPIIIVITLNVLGIPVAPNLQSEQKLR